MTTGSPTRLKVLRGETYQGKEDPLRSSKIDKRRNVLAQKRPPLGVLAPQARNEMAKSSDDSSMRPTTCGKDHPKQGRRQHREPIYQQGGVSPSRVEGL